MKEQTLSERIKRMQEFIQKWDGVTRKELTDHAKNILKKLEKERKEKIG